MDPSIIKFLEEDEDETMHSGVDMAAFTDALSREIGGSIRKLGINQVIMARNGVARAISVKDVIAILEREHQMSSSTLIYRLYDNIRSESSAE